jgi:membrane protein implicated in regulation of membrane protease activity
MDETRATDVADAAGALGAGLGIITIQLFPFAVPLLVLVIGPLALLALPVLLLGLLALPVLMPLWLFRALRRRRRTDPDRPRPDALGSQHLVRPGVLSEAGADRGLAVRLHDQ